MAFSKAEVAKLSPAELGKLQQTLAEVAKEKQAEADSQAKAEIEAVLKKYNTSLDRLGYVKGKGKSKGKSNLPAKYQDGTNTWGGKGKMPDWIKDKISKGIDPKTFLVAGQTASPAVNNLWQKAKGKKK